MPDYSWTDDRVTTLRQLHAKGCSGKEVAKALGGVTRNAVIGKLSRLGLGNVGGGRGASPRTVASNVNRPRPIPNVRAPKPVPARVAPAVNEAAPRASAAAPPPESSVLLINAGPRHCRFPVGAATGADLACCGAPTAADEVYCLDCRGKAGGRRVAPSQAERSAKALTSFVTRHERARFRGWGAQ